MNINQAKKIAGIGTSVRIFGRDALNAAVSECLKRIVKARKNNDDVLAAKLSEAKALFTRRLRRNTCAVCGETIARGADHCRIHRKGPQAKQLMGSAFEAAKAKSARKNSNARVGISEDELAPFGYYAPSVKKVVAKWHMIPEEILRHYFFIVACPIVFRKTHLNLHLAVISSQHLQAVFELAAAVSKLCTDRRKPHPWLLGGEVAVNGKFETTAEIRARIIRQGGPEFTIGALEKADRRLRISATRAQKKLWRFR